MGDNSSLSQQAGSGEASPTPVRAARGRLLVASNRGPLSFAMAPDGSLSARRGGGGLVSGLMPGLSALAAQAEVLWICAALSDADRAAARQDPDGRRFGIDGASPGASPSGGRTAVRTLDIPSGILRRTMSANGTSAWSACVPPRAPRFLPWPKVRPRSQRW